MPNDKIHRIVAKKINDETRKYQNKEFKLFEFGSIAPDSWRNTASITRLDSHFNSPKAFLKKYKNTLDNPFMFGYYVHILTDYYWYSLIRNNLIYNDSHYRKLINDYNLNDLTLKDSEEITIPLIPEIDLEGLKITLRFLKENPISSRLVEENYQEFIESINECTYKVLKEIKETINQ